MRSREGVGRVERKEEVEGGEGGIGSRRGEREGGRGSVGRRGEDGEGLG